MPRPDSTPKQRPSLKDILSGVLTMQQLYVLVAALMVLVNARLFYGSLKAQTEHVLLWFEPTGARAVFEGAREAAWSAPLDDVFIHFDFARATARGYPFEWIEGNGYSSGGTSLLYPFVLSLGFVLGLQGLDLAHFAAIVACVGTFATLLGARRMFKDLPQWTALLAPVAMLSVGALNWTLFSGMEVALFLGIWGLVYVLWDELMDAIVDGKATRIQALVLGLACAVLVGCRPEAAPIVAVLGLWASGLVVKKSRVKKSGVQNGVWTVLLIGVPGALIIVGHMVANKVLTGDSAAAGALAKLEMHHPYLTDKQVWDSWIFYLKYQFLRLSDYHFSAYPVIGYLVWPLALLTLAFGKTRRTGILLLTSIVLWMALVALNGQVRWQNERYTMPAVAWLLLAAALGMAGVFDWALARREGRVVGYFSAAVTAAAAILFVYGQAPRFRDQVWFFGRASRNILEQHVRAAEYLSEPELRHRRVLISDAGAIPYMSDLPAFDLIGLGGYGGLPIARASRQGVGAAVELLEHVPSRDLPDVMALYPSWWGDFVLWFGQRTHEFPVRGNVICGGASKVIYQPDWTPLFHSGEPFAIRPEERIVDILDVADVLSEEAHQATWNREAQGYVGMKLLPDPRNPARDLWDAGRVLSTNMKLDFTMEGFVTDAPAMLIRVAPAQAATMVLRVGNRTSDPIEVLASDFWQEIRVPLPSGLKKAPFSLEVTDGQLHVYHLFAVEASSGSRVENDDDDESQASSPVAVEPNAVQE